MAAERRAVEVWADGAPFGARARLGVLHTTPARGRGVFAFEYGATWLARQDARPLDPTLQLVRGPQYLADDRDNFGLFLDSSPDRWGRLLLQRREALRARAGKRAERRLGELDYLLGVFDGHRLGSLRYCLPGGPFLDDDVELASPPWTSLRALEQASLHLERPGSERDPKYGAWLRMLIAPGRSLGGARPKASVVDPRGRLWIAKFPSDRDDVDIGGWESVVHAIATRAGVITAEAQRKKLGSHHHTFLARRFDRDDTGGRLHFASAMTLIQRSDGDLGASYLDLAAFIAQQGAHPARDLEQLWRRIALSVCVSNVDDHLRNHGFLLEPKGWSLAPAYDMNPVAHGDGLTLNISETDNAQDVELVLGVAKHFRIKPRRACAIFDEVIAASRTWRAEARRAKISRGEQDQMATAFRVGEG
ncbi:MAG: type II toxin-antitoxin system HipA family toxin [Polyangiales bacterium]